MTIPIDPSQQVSRSISPYSNDASKDMAGVPASSGGYPPQVRNGLGPGVGYPPVLPPVQKFAFTYAARI